MPEHQDAGKALVSVHLLPILIFAQVMLYLDRVNIGYAALTMNTALSIGARDFGFVAGIFSIGYALFEIPGNLMAHRVGLSRWLAGVMLLWGLVAASTALAWNTTSLAVLRFLLGVAEGGFLPALFLYIGRFFGSGSRGGVMSMMMIGSATANILAGPISTAMLSISALGLQGWQWLFILQGLPPVLLGLAMFRWPLLPETPNEASWLPDDAKTALMAQIAQEELAKRTAPDGARFSTALRKPAVWIYSSAYFFYAIPFGALAAWLPQLVRKQFATLANVEIGVLCVAPFVFGLAFILIMGRVLDVTGDCRRFLIAIGLVACACILGAIEIHTPAIAFVLVALPVGMLFAYPVAFWPAPMAALGGTAAAGGFALVNSFGALGTFVGPYAFGYFQSATGSTQTGLLVDAAFALAAAAVPFVFRDRFRLNALRDHAAATARALDIRSESALTPQIDTGSIDR